MTSNVSHCIRKQHYPTYNIVENFCVKIENLLLQTIKTKQTLVNNKKRKNGYTWAICKHVSKKKHYVTALDVSQIKSKTRDLKVPL